MSVRNKLEAKRERAKEKYLKKITHMWNTPYPNQRPYRDFVKEYWEGKIKLTKKGGEYIMDDQNQTTDPNASAPTDQPASEPQAEAPATEGSEGSTGEGEQAPAGEEAPATDQPAA